MPMRGVFDTSLCANLSVTYGGESFSGYSTSKILRHAITAI